MIENDLKNMGDRIQTIVEDCIDSMDFKMLNKNVSQSIQSVFEELHIPFYHYQENDKHTKTDTSVVIPKELYPERMPEKFKGRMMCISGGILTGIFGFAALVSSGLMLLSGTSFRWIFQLVTVTVFPFFVASIILLLFGVTIIRRGKRFWQYRQIIGEKKYCDIAILANQTGRNIKFIQKDLLTMIDKKYFLEARFDELKTCIILDHETYQQYLQANAVYKEKLNQQKAIHEEENNIFSTNNQNNEELIKAIEDGRQYIYKIRAANDAIPGKIISEKLDLLEMLIKKIFEVIKNKPEQLPKIRKFMRYYMPTTLRLVETYQRLDCQSIQSEKILQSKREIESTIDTVNEAYKNLLDSFFDDEMLHLNSDMKVLKAMLEQEGLTR